MERAFADAGVWIALVDADDSKRHGPAAAAVREWFGRLVTTNFIFDEALTRCARVARLGLAAAVRIGEQLLDPDAVDLVRVTPEDERAAWAIFRSQPAPARPRERPLSFTDCTSFAVMRRLGISTALTFDRHFAREKFRVPPLD